MSTEVTAVVLALVGVAAVVAVSWVFYRIGRAEDRDREAAVARRPREPEPPPEDAPHSPGLARERRRPGPRRRPR